MTAPSTAAETKSGECPGEPQYGRRLVPAVVDQIAREEPMREAFQIPVSDDAKDGWRVVTWQEYAKAIDACAWMITQTCGQFEAGGPPTLAYIGPQDVRYVVFFIAALKANCRALYISPRNTKEGQINLFRRTNCRHVFCAEPFVHAARSWQSEFDLKVIEVGTYESWAQQSNVPHVSYNKTWEDAEWAAGMVGVGDACHNVDEWEGFTHWVPVWSQESKRHFIPVSEGCRASPGVVYLRARVLTMCKMPLFHAAALYCFIICVIWWKSPVALGIGSRPLTADLVLECLANLDVNTALLPPSILQDLSRDEEALSALRKLKFVIFGGGSLAEDTGNHIAKRGIHLLNIVSSTEFTPWPMYFQPRPELWQYMIINPDGIDWRQVDGNIYELVMVRKHKHPGLQGMFYTFPDLQEVSTNDLFERHPTLPNHWRYHCRADDIIVLSNGEKLNPVTIEGMIEGHPQVKGVLVFGAQRFQAGLLVEPIRPIVDESEKTDFINELWPQIERANNATVAHGQIGKELIMLTVPEKPMGRAGKGTIQRNPTLASYKTEIDKLYEKLELIPHEQVDVLDLSPEGIMQLVHNTFALDIPDLTLDADTNFFSVGMDSLQVMNISRRLRASLDAAGHGDLTPSELARGIYNNPTPQRLSRHLLGLIDGRARESTEDSDTDVEREVEVMRGLYEKYTAGLKAGLARPDASSKDQVIVLTGSTGGLGSHLLAGLLEDGSVRRVVCLNRAQDGGYDQQVRSMNERGLVPLRTGKAEFHQISVGAPGLGLPDDVYSRLLNEADRIIHCGWPVNFNISTDTFEPHLRGVRSLCDLAAQATKRIVYVFISSIGTTANWDPARGHVPEEPLRDWNLPGSGYGRSKLIASAIIEDAAVVGNFPAASIRVGQIAGSESGTGAPWNKNEWLPSIIASSVHLAALPRDLGRFNRVDWIPIEQVAGSILDMAGVRDTSLTGSKEPISGYYHCVNATAITWEDLAPSVQAFYGDRIRDLVSFKDWVARLEKSQTSVDARATADNPGLKLLDTYQAAVSDTEDKSTVYDVSRACHTSSTLRETGAITADMIKMWCAQWKL